MGGDHRGHKEHQHQQLVDRRHVRRDSDDRDHDQGVTRADDQGPQGATEAASDPTNIDRTEQPGTKIGQTVNGDLSPGNGMFEAEVGKKDDRLPSNVRHGTS